MVLNFAPCYTLLNSFEGTPCAYLYCTLPVVPMELLSILREILSCVSTHVSRKQGTRMYYVYYDIVFLFLLSYYEPSISICWFGKCFEIVFLIVAIATESTYVQVTFGVFLKWILEKVTFNEFMLNSKLMNLLIYIHDDNLILPL